MIEQMLTPEEIEQKMSMYPRAKTLIFDDKTDYKGLRPVQDYLQGFDFVNHKIYCEHAKFNHDEVKLVLKQLKYISDNDIYGACYAYDNIPFYDTRPEEWKIVRETHIIKIWHKDKIHSYTFDQHSGNVNMYKDGQKSTLGKQAAAIQYLVSEYYALPLYFYPKHLANGKTLHDLNIAAPDLALLHKVIETIYNDKDLIIEWFNNKLYEEFQFHKHKEYNILLESVIREHNINLSKLLSS